MSKQIMAGGASIIQRIIAMALVACLAGCSMKVGVVEWCREACEPLGGLSNITYDYALKCGCVNGVGIYPNRNEVK